MVVITTVMKSSVVSKGLIFVSQHTVPLEGKSGQEMEQRPWKDAAHCLVCPAQLAFLCTNQDRLSRDGAAHRAMGPLASIKEIPSQTRLPANPMVAFS